MFDIKELLGNIISNPTQDPMAKLNPLSPQNLIGQVMPGQEENVEAAMNPQASMFKKLMSMVGRR